MSGSRRHSSGWVWGSLLTNTSPTYLAQLQPQQLPHTTRGLHP
jgi:hypothetical protein